MSKPRHWLFRPLPTVIGLPLIFCCIGPACLIGITSPRKAPTPTAASPKPAVPAKPEEKRITLQDRIDAGEVKPVSVPKSSNKDTQEKLDCFWSAIEGYRKAKAVTFVDVHGDDVTVTMSPAFSLQPYELRLRVAQTMLRMWADCCGQDGLPTMTMQATTGREIGGSGFTGVWVEKR